MRRFLLGILCLIFAGTVAAVSTSHVTVNITGAKIGQKVDLRTGYSDGKSPGVNS